MRYVKELARVGERLLARATESDGGATRPALHYERDSMNRCASTNENIRRQWNCCNAPRTLSLSKSRSRVTKQTSSSASGILRPRRYSRTDAQTIASDA